MPYPTPARATAALSALVAVCSTWLVAAPADAAAPPTCEGKPVTIVATTTVTQGTEGDDVVAMEPGEWNTFDAGGGNDTVCLAAGRADLNDRDSRPPYGFLDAGNGDDRVVNLAPAGTTGTSTTVVLGLGSDSFQGAGVGEEVFADGFEGDGDVADVAEPGLVGPQADVVTGAATVHTAAPGDAPNADRVTFGARGGRAVVSGPMGPQALLDFSLAPDPILEVRSPLRLGAPFSGEVVVDNRARTVTAAGATALTWSGEVRTFVVGSPRRLPVAGPAVGFVGTDAGEAVTLSDVLVGDVSLGGGADRLDVQSWNNAFVPRSADGGPGRDEASLSSVCHGGLAVRLGRTATCDGRSGRFTGFRDVVVDGSDASGAATVLVGTDRGERLVASGHDVTVRARGGRDDVLVDDSWSARVWAGPGRDRVAASGDDVVVRGEGGADRLRLLGTAGLPAPDRARRRQVSLGGRGRDVMVGTAAAADRLVGGAGRDRADGGRGPRDRCDAEVVRRCEV